MALLSKPTRCQANDLASSARGQINGPDLTLTFANRAKVAGLAKEGVRKVGGRRGRERGKQNARKPTAYLSIIAIVRRHCIRSLATSTLVVVVALASNCCWLHVASKFCNLTNPFQPTNTARIRDSPIVCAEQSIGDPSSADSGRATSRATCWALELPLQQVAAES